MIRHRLLAPILVATIATVAVSACGSDSASTADTTATTVAMTDSTAASSETSAAFNDADVTFAQGMIPHHEQAVEMADIALDPAIGAGTAVMDLATRIKGAQDPEIQMMSGWLTAWDQPMDMGASDGHDMATMDGMMSADDMNALGKLTGEAFDTMWLEMMIEHHTGAISMAETVKAEGSNPDVLSLADQIITAQQSEIDEMNTLLGN